MLDPRTLTPRPLPTGGVIRKPAVGPLAGCVVIDMSVVVAGPWVSGLMAELGAQVIKVECEGLPDR